MRTHWIPRLVSALSLLLLPALHGCGGTAPAPADPPPRGAASEEASPAATSPEEEARLAALRACPPIPEGPADEQTIHIGAVPESHWPAVHCRMRAIMAEDTCEVGEPPELQRVDLAEPPPLSGAVQRACQGLTRRVTRQLRAPLPRSWQAHDRQLGGEDEESEETSLGTSVRDLRSLFGRCVAAGAGAWALEPVEERFVVEEGSDSGGLGGSSGEDVYATRYELRARLVYLDAQGGVTPGEAEATPFLFAPGGEVVERYPALRPLHDYDGDGRTEIVLVVSESEGEMGGGRTLTSLRTATAEGIREVPLPPGADIVGWVDYDGDGRPDARSAAPYGLRECQETSDPMPTPGVLLHAAEGLRFSASDAVAERWWRSFCPCAPSRLLERPGPDPMERDHPLYDRATLVRLACARVWGASREELLRRLGAELSALPAEVTEEESCAYGREFFEHFLEPEPPLTLRPAADTASQPTEEHQ